MSLHFVEVLLPLEEEVIEGAAYSHRMSFWSTCQLIEKFEIILCDIIRIIVYMTILIVQM